LSPGRPTAAAQNRIRPADRWSPATAIDAGDSYLCNRIDDKRQ